MTAQPTSNMTDTVPEIIPTTTIMTSQQDSVVSVIIPCYNHGKYLATAIESILSQSYKNFEIVVVDDGSTDNTKEVAEQYKEVIYVYQPNQGLSSARNKGTEKSTGKFFVFLDADDWLFPDALFININYLASNPNLAFVSGAHKLFFEAINKTSIINIDLIDSVYCHLLERNYIGNPAAVMFQRWVFDSFKYDTTINPCSDYDMYLKVSRKYPVISHKELISNYRIHGENMSSNYIMMLNDTLLVLERQKGFLISEKEEKCFAKGVKFFISYYTEQVFYKLQNQFKDQKTKVSKQDLKYLKENNKSLYKKFILFVIKEEVKSLIGKNKFLQKLLLR